MQNIKLTPAQTWLVHTLETLFLAAVVAGTVAGYQTVATGNYSVQDILGVIAAALVAVLAKGASTSILGNANLLPAIFDTVKDIQAVASSPPAPPVVIHNNLPAQPAPQAAPAPVQPVQPQAFTQVQQVPFEAIPQMTAPLAAIRQTGQ